MAETGDPFEPYGRPLSQTGDRYGETVIGMDLFTFTHASNIFFQ